jgi:hypothetical protein
MQITITQDQFELLLHVLNEAARDAERAVERCVGEEWERYFRDLTRLITYLETRKRR